MQTEKPLSDYERERGKPVPSKLHSVVQTNLTGLFLQYRPRLQVLSELTLELDDRELTPDLSVYAELEVDFTHDELRMAEPPLLAVEIASPTQSVQDLVDKIRFLIGHGVQTCWLVQPPLRTITVFTEGMESTTYDQGSVTDPVTEIEVDVDEVFATP
ncbi:MAG: Uma2 family endonuclease [Salinibacter sp.]